MPGKIEKYEFVPLMIAKRGWVKGDLIQYRVYSSPEEFVVIETERASRAVELSGIENPYRVERIILSYQNKVEEEDMTEITEQEEFSELDKLMRQSPVLGNRTIEDLLRKEETETRALENPAGQVPPPAAAEASVPGAIPPV